MSGDAGSPRNGPLSTSSTGDNPAQGDRVLDGALLDGLWDFEDPAASEARFRTLLADAPAGAQATEELRTQLARSLGLQGRFNEATSLLDEVEAALGADPAVRPTLRARLLLERGRVLNSGGSPAAAVPIFQKALTTATESENDFLAADAAHMLAIADREHAHAWTRRGLDIVGTGTDPRTSRWAGSLHHNLGWWLHDAGRFDDALAEFRSALDAYRRAGTGPQTRIARWAVGRCLRSLGRYHEALAIQTELSQGSSDGYVDEEIGELLLVLGRTAEATPHFAVAAEKLAADAWLAEHEPERIERLRTLGAPPGSSR